MKPVLQKYQEPSGGAWKAGVLTEFLREGLIAVG
jgi:hypothetical protein